MATDALTPAQQPHEASSALSSHLQDRTRPLDAATSAEHRVIEYLLALGLVDEQRLIALASEVMASLPRDLDESLLAGRAIEAMQARVGAFRRDVFGEREAEVHPLWLRAFLAMHPTALCGDVPTVKAQVSAFGDPFVGKPPARRTFDDQSLDRMQLPPWLTNLVPPLLLALGATAVLGHELFANGVTLPEVVFLGLFAFLSSLGAMGLHTAVRGFARGDDVMPEVPASATLPRSAIIMPIYHESAEHVFAALLAMREALARTPGGNSFEVFVLSDSRDPDRIADEERAFRRTVSSGNAAIPMFYRRRARNEHQKAGNLAEFFERFGHRYTYAVVLDADSVMHADTILSLVRRMEADPQLGLLQAPLALHGATSVFARTHQFAASVYGPVFMRGLAAWSGDDGNYYGHNAAVRVRAFLECCALPKLRGEPPFGGTILSHDFVEAALLCRAGWKVRTATDLGGSFEELPETVVEYVARDRRWCQGNLQHVRIALAEGLRPMSRLHMSVGVSAFLAGPAWLVFVALGAGLATAQATPLVPPAVSLGLSVLAATMLLGPRVLGLLDALRDERRRRTHGGPLRLVFGVLFEALSSVFIAPIVMLHHARIVISILLGNAVMWGAQARRSGTGLGAVVRSELPTTLAGAGTAGLLVAYEPGLLPWLAPVYVPWLLAIPVTAILSSRGVGAVVRRQGLYSVPTELEADELLVRADALRAFTASDATARFRDIVLDPVLLAAKLASLPRAPEPPDPTQRASLERLVERALRVGPAALTPDEQGLVTRDAELMQRLHREAWQRWPVESWSQGRERPQLPPEPSLLASEVG